VVLRQSLEWEAPTDRSHATLSRVTLEPNDRQVAQNSKGHGAVVVAALLMSVTDQGLQKGLHLGPEFDRCELAANDPLSHQQSYQPENAIHKNQSASYKYHAPAYDTHSIGASIIYRHRWRGSGFMRV
jgi:hypothetical protein